MKISELKEGVGKVGLEAEIVGVGEAREINKGNRMLRVANATLRDETGTIELVLWNENIDRVSEGDLVRVENGFVSRWQNKLQLTLGKFGKLIVLD
jgi:replication factor A1